MATPNDWEKATADRAEHIAQLARFATIDNLTHNDIDSQQTVNHTLFVQVELIQNIIHNYEGYPVAWNAANSYRKFKEEMSRLEGTPRQMYEMELLLAKRKELIRDIVLNLISPINRVSIELEKHKVLTLAHISHQLRPLLYKHHQDLKHLKGSNLIEHNSDLLGQALDLHLSPQSTQD